MRIPDTMWDMPAVTRLEIMDSREVMPPAPASEHDIDHRYLGVRIMMSLQDGGRTLKIFMSDRDDGITAETVTATMTDGLAEFIKTPITREGQD
jgi:hypothetical protein